MRIEASMRIESSPERVWQVLTAFEEYRRWNPFIEDVDGDLRVGARLNVVLHPPGGARFAGPATVRVATAPVELSWVQRFTFPGLFDREHTFVIRHENARSCRFLHRMSCSGVLLPLLWPGLESKLTQGCEAMNAALKQSAEEEIDHVEQRMVSQVAGTMR
jgi:hypothetical protein